MSDWLVLILVEASTLSKNMSKVWVSPVSTSETVHESSIAPADTVTPFFGAITSAGNGA